MIQNFRNSLPLQMAIATLLGIFTGIFLGDVASIFSSWANAYIMILKITAIPFLSLAIVHGIGQLNSGQAKQILKKGLFFIGLAVFINICMIYTIKWVLPNSDSMQALSYQSREITPLNFSNLLIPENIFYDLSNNVVPAVVVFSLLLGIALMHLPDKQATMSSLNTALEALTRITGWISRITPVGTFLIMSNQIGSMEFSTIKQMATYIILYILATSLIIFWICPRLASVLTSLGSAQWLKSLVPVLVLAYTTNLVIVCLPYIINIVQREVQQLYPKDDNLRTQIQGTVSIIFNLPLGSLYITAFVFFIAVFYASPLTMDGQFQLFLTTFLTSLGAVGIGSWINNLTFILNSLALPLDAVNLYLATLPFTAGFQAMVSVMLISTLSLIITLSCRGLLNLQFKKIAYGSTLTLLPLICLFSGLKYFNPLPKIQNSHKSIYDLEIRADLNIKTFLPGETIPIPDLIPGEDALDRILRTKTLRIGYNASTAPFCFFNKNGQLAGYDVAFAIELAFDLGCDVQFIPMNFANMSQEFQQDFYDIAMSAVSITGERLKTLAFPVHYLDAELVFVTKALNRKTLASLDHIKSNHALRIAALKGSSFERIARVEFPFHSLLLLDDYDEFAQVAEPSDLLLWEEQEAIVWAVKHMAFQVVSPRPGLGKDTLGYPVREKNSKWQGYLTAWARLKQNEEFHGKQYNLWVLGKTESVVEYEPRWSIIRNVFKWVK